MATRSCTRAVEQALRCPICLDSMTNCVITQCRHRFCESCILAALKQKKECPTCRCRISSHRACPLFGATWTKAIKGDEVVGPEDSWACATCTLVNPLATGRCLACGARRPSSSVVRCAQALSSSLEAPTDHGRGSDRDELSDSGCVQVLLEAMEMTAADRGTPQEPAPQSLAPVVSMREPAPGLIGRRVEVFWGGDREWYAGRLVEQRVCRGHVECRVAYDDGVQEWHSFDAETDFRWCDESGGGAGPAAVKTEAAVADDSTSGATAACPVNSRLQPRGEITKRTRTGRSGRRRPSKKPRLHTAAAPHEERQDLAVHRESDKGYFLVDRPTKTGYLGVHLSTNAKLPFRADGYKDGRPVPLGRFATAEQAAAAFAVHYRERLREREAAAKPRLTLEEAETKAAAEGLQLIDSARGTTGYKYFRNSPPPTLCFPLLPRLGPNWCRDTICFHKP